MLKAKGIHKSYNDLQVLRGIDLCIKQGEIVSIIGASGAGKSTLLHILGTLDASDRGSITINEIAIEKLSKKELSKFRNNSIGFVFQFHNLFPEFTALENVCIPAYIKRDKSAEQKASKLLKVLGMNNKAHHKPSELSGGEQQRVAVARALINNPPIVLADEPSGNLDSQGAAELHQLFFDLRKEMNQTFVIVTHNVELARMADRKLEIRDGVIVLG